MSKQPFFTIGIPVYNTEKWVCECIKSILTQDFNDFELICLDDGSTDKSLEILNQFAEKDNRIKIISRQNGGVSTARNAIIAHACGKYIFMIDSDDIMCKNIFGAAYKKIVEDNYPDILQLGLIKDHKWNKSLIEWIPTFPYSHSEYGKVYNTPPLSKDEFAVRLWLDNKMSAWASTRFVKTSIITNNGIMFNENYCSREDGDFSIRLYRKIETVSILPIPAFVYYLPREGSLSTVFSHKSFKSVISYYRDFFEEVEFWDLSEKTRQELLKEKERIFTEQRDYLLTIFDNSKTREEIIKDAAMVERLAGSYIKSLPIPKNKNGLIFLLFRIIGIENTMKILYYYLNKKGIV